MYGRWEVSWLVVDAEKISPRAIQPPLLSRETLSDILNKSLDLVSESRTFAVEFLNRGRDFVILT